MARTKISKAEFDATAQVFGEELASRLAEEVNPDEFSVVFEDQGAATDLWELPEVPSKAVVKLSGMVEEHLGVKLPPKFIRPGGYRTVEDAVAHIMEQLRTMCHD
jgi:acyl carrier protein